MFVSFEIVLFYGADIACRILILTIPLILFIIPPAIPSAQDPDGTQPKGGRVPGNPDGLQAQRILAKKGSSPRWPRQSWLFLLSSFLSVFCSVPTESLLAGNSCEAMLGETRERMSEQME